MNVAQELEKINISNNPSKELWQFFQDAEFIDETINVLESDNVAHKKSYFIENQAEVMDTLENLRICLEIANQRSTIPSDEQQSYSTLYKLIGITIKRIEEGIDRFNTELTDGVSSKSVKEDIVVSEDTIKDAMQNNETTMQIARDLKNPRKTELDERTAQIQKDFNKLAYQKKMAQQQQTVFHQQPQQALIPGGYLVTSQDLSECKVISGTNLSKDVLNKLIEKSGIDNARLFKLTEIPTKQKTIQKVVTVVG